MVLRRCPCPQSVAIHPHPRRDLSTCLATHWVLCVDAPAHGAMSVCGWWRQGRHNAACVPVHHTLCDGTHGGCPCLPDAPTPPPPRTHPPGQMRVPGPGCWPARCMGRRRGPRVEQLGPPRVVPHHLPLQLGYRRCARRSALCSPAFRGSMVSHCTGVSSCGGPHCKVPRCRMPCRPLTHPRHPWTTASFLRTGFTERTSLARTCWYVKPVGALCWVAGGVMVDD
jgi:hypothetical protein